MTDPVTPTDQADEHLPADEPDETQTGAGIGDRPDEPQDEPLPPEVDVPEVDA